MIKLEWALLGWKRKAKIVGTVVCASTHNGFSQHSRHANPKTTKALKRGIRHSASVQASPPCSERACAYHVYERLLYLACALAPGNSLIT